LRDLGNTIVVVEHDADLMRAADHIVDLGPGAGELGGRITYEGSFGELMADGAGSLTGVTCGVKLAGHGRSCGGRSIPNGW